MNCPEHLVFSKRGLWIWMYWRDVPRKSIPIRVWLNPLRYEIGYVRRGRRLFTLNDEGRAWGHVQWFFLRNWRAIFGDKP